MLSGAAPAADIEVVITDGCKGGLSGIATDGRVKIRFSACPKEVAICHTAISKGDGRPLTEVNVDPSALSFKLAGIEISDKVDLSKDELNRIQAAFTCPESDLAERLWPKLVSMGFAPHTPAMYCLNYNMQMFQNNVKFKVPPK